PQGIGRPPVALVAVDDHGRVPADSTRGHHGGELLGVDVVAREGVVEVLVPVELECGGDVPGVVEQDVLVGLEDDEVLARPGGSSRDPLGEPCSGDEALRMRVLGDLAVLDVVVGHNLTLLLSIVLAKAGPDRWKADCPSDFWDSRVMAGLSLGPISGGQATPLTVSGLEVEVNSDGCGVDDLSFCGAVSVTVPAEAVWDDFVAAAVAQQ